MSIHKQLRQPSTAFVSTRYGTTLLLTRYYPINNVYYLLRAVSPLLLSVLAGAIHPSLPLRSVFHVIEPRRWRRRKIIVLLRTVVTVTTANALVAAWHTPCWSVVGHRWSTNLGRCTIVVVTASTSSRGQSIAPPSTTDPSIAIMHRSLSMGQAASTRHLASVPSLITIGIRKGHASDTMGT